MSTQQHRQIFWRVGDGYADLAAAIRALGPVLGQRSKRAKKLRVRWMVEITTCERPARRR